MPQMFPLLWLILFILSALALLTVKSILYFLYKPNPNTFSMKTSKAEHIWKW